MRSKEIGFAGAVVAVAFGAVACGASGGKAAASAPSSVVTPSAVRMVVPFTADKLQDALLHAPVWGEGWTDVKDGPLVNSSVLGAVGQIPGEDCWTAVYSGSRVGSVAAVEDVVDSGRGDIAHQNIYQFASGDAVTAVTATAKKRNECGTFKHTDDNSMAFTVQSHDEPVPGLGDQAVKSVVESVSAQSGTDELVSLTVRYGDVVIDVGYDSSIATTALDYDLADKVTLIAAKLGLTAAGS